MNSFDQIARLLLAASAIAAAACFHPRLDGYRDAPASKAASKSRRDAAIHVPRGFYCNPEDPRAVVHRPLGRGYTINLRHEHFVSVFVVMLGLAMFITLLLCVVPAQ